MASLFARRLSGGSRHRQRPLALAVDCRHEVALECPGGTKAISLGFQPEVSVAHQHYASRRDASDARRRGLVLCMISSASQA